MTSKMFLSIAIVSLFYTSFAFTVSAGDIVGKITFNGKPPPEKEIKFDADPKCKAQHSTTATTKHYEVDASGGLANVFVYVKDGLGSKKFPTPTQPLVLEQRTCLYQPYVMGVQVGQTLVIENGDDTLHNIHALTAPGKNQEFNIGQPMKGMKSEKKFTKPEVFVKFKCDVHPWMFAYVGVVDHPFFAVTGADGSYKINGLPDGEYTLAAVHPKAGEKTMKVKVAGGEVKADFVFSPKTSS